MEALTKHLDQFGLDDDTRARLAEKFDSFVTQAKEWEAKVKSIKVTDATQVALMQQAKEGRKIIQKVRTDSEKLKKDLKDGTIKYNRAVDFLYNFVVGVCKPLEEYLEEQEKFVEVQQKKARLELQLKREAELRPWVTDPSVFDLANMPEDTYQMVLAGSIKAHEDKIKAEKQAEIDRIAKEKEDERIRVENEVLRKKAEEQEAKLRQERKDAEEKMRLERLEREKSEKALRDKLAEQEREKKALEEKERKEAQARLEAQKQEEKRQKAEERKARLAPDKDKLIYLAQTISELSMPVVKSDEAKKVVGDVQTLLDKVVGHIHDNIRRLYSGT